VQPGPSVTRNLPQPQLNCTMPMEKLDCQSCSEEGDKVTGRVMLYSGVHAGTGRGRRTLYSLDPQAGDRRTYGETVNGKFKVPGPGQLRVEVRGAGGAADVWTATTANGAGWQEQPHDAVDARRGSPLLSSRCIWWTEAQAAAPGAGLQFSIRTFRGIADELALTFHWYQLDEEKCCLLHEREELVVSVRPLPCLFSPNDPVRPELNDIENGAATAARLRCCAKCLPGSDVCPSGNLSDFFVVWPAASGLIRDGHAQGWRLEGMELRAPESDGLSYEFEDFPEKK